MDQVMSGQPGDDRECVKCGHVKRDASWDALEECPSCGVIMAKARPARPRSRSQAQAQAQVAPERPATSSKKPSEAWMLWLGIGVVIGMAAVSWPRDGQERRARPSNKAEAYLDDARFPCREAIESLARFDIRFANFDSPMPESARMLDGKAEFYGDDLEAQNGFGAWQKMTYVCTYDPVTQVATAIVVPRP